jgi:hypothetical protein
MPEYPKYEPTPFDSLPIEGLHFVDGYIIDTVFLKDLADENKYPFIEFPSGVARIILESSQPDDVGKMGAMEQKIGLSKVLAL